MWGGGGVFKNIFMDWGVRIGDFWRKDVLLFFEMFNYN